MEKTNRYWVVGLLLLVGAAGAAYWYSVVYTEWNVPLYNVCMALFFLLGAAGFALPAAAKGKPKKRLLLSALAGGVLTVGGIFAIGFFVNNILMHERGARFAAVATAAYGCALALFCVLRLKRHTQAKLFFRPMAGILLSLAVFAAGFAGVIPAGYLAPDRNGTDALRKAAETETASATEKRYGTDALQGEDGTLTVAFIGGSLTEGRITYENGVPRSSNVWTDDVLQFLAKKYPQKTLRAVNAGKGGTNSRYGAQRFGYDVEPYAPDLLFIEFSVNDSGAKQWLEPDEDGTAETQLYLEYMLRRCQQMQKEPAVIYLHTPIPVETDTALYGVWKEGADLKTALCGYYGVPVIDIYSTLHNAYQNAGTDLSLEDWLLENGWYNPGADGGLDVHPNADGYRTFYSAAVVGALENDWDSMIRLPAHKPVYCKNNASYLNGTYSYVECADPRLSFSEGWRVYKSRLTRWMDPSDDAVPEPFLEYPHFTAGIAQVKNSPGAFFSYETDADALDMGVVSSDRGLSATVLCGEEAMGELTCGSIYTNMDYPAGTVTLPGGGKPHKITVRVNDPTQETYLFRFGYLIEFRNGSERTDPI